MPIVIIKKINMPKSLFIILFFIIIQNTLFSQTNHSLYGEVFDKRDNTPIVGAIVSIPNSQISQQTNENGHFHFYNLKENEIELQIQALGYKLFKKVYSLNNVDNHIALTLERQDHALSEVVVTNRKAIESTLNNQMIGKSFVFENHSINFIKTLSKLPGVESMDIGAGFSKPMIRGFGFNRLAVIDKGITQQDQQWGADHGLEIDQFDIEDAVVYKGPMSLQFGSDAIGGAIEILPENIPQKNIYYGDVTMVGKSNNDLLGVSIMNGLKVNHWFFKFRYTNQRYSDYRVPADKFTYLKTVLPIYNHRLKNTAGKEENISGLINYTNGKLSNTINVSNIYQKNGFFEGAHGIPSADRLVQDGSYRNIDMPYTNVNHFKVINNTTLNISPKLKFSTDLGYQYNHRQEWSYFHTHYDNQTAPEKNPNLELDFKLHTYSLNTKLEFKQDDKWKHIFGIQSSYQNNDVSGYTFLLPKYNQFSIGGFALTDYNLNKEWTLSGGLRYDYARLNISGFYDNTLAEYLRKQGYTQSDIDSYAQLAYNIKPHYSNLSASIGAIYKPNSTNVWKFNLGKSFRFPTANELASNGVHHGAFRHEQGDPKLKSEQGYQFDVSYTLDKGIYSLTLSPYISYFSNYIFLAPQGQWSVLPHAGQIYKYSEAEALFFGGEYDFNVAVLPHIDLRTSGQYVYNKNLTDKHPLPFTPPFSMRNEIAYNNKYKSIQSYKISFEHQLIAAQNRNAQNEERTPGTNLFNLSLNGNLLINKFRFSVGFQIQNIFNTKYLNHLSFYRKIEIPEPGRNIQLLIKIPFYN